MVPADSVSSGAFLPGWLSFHCNPVEGAREFCGASFIRALIPFMGTPPHDLITSWYHHLGGYDFNI